MSSGPPTSSAAARVRTSVVTTRTKRRCGSACTSLLSTSVFPDASHPSGGLSKNLGFFSHARAVGGPAAAVDSSPSTRSRSSAGNNRRKQLQKIFLLHVAFTYLLSSFLHSASFTSSEDPGVFSSWRSSSQETTNVVSCSRRTSSTSTPPSLGTSSGGGIRIFAAGLKVVKKRAAKRSVGRKASSWVNYIHSEQSKNEEEQDLQRLHRITKTTTSDTTKRMTSASSKNSRNNDQNHSSSNIISKKKNPAGVSSLDKTSSLNRDSDKHFTPQTFKANAFFASLFSKKKSRGEQQRERGTRPDLRCGQEFGTMDQGVEIRVVPDSYPYMKEVKWICDKMTQQGRVDNGRLNYKEFSGNVTTGVPESKEHNPVTHNYVACDEENAEVQKCTVGLICPGCKFAECTGTLTTLDVVDCES
ncbi:unnamed protein product [Amoebophrya sp. A120]|nr:unnamed protein product [Amoebophrya sp. A120]|eukprot:GSA120T00019916001.1